MLMFIVRRLLSAIPVVIAVSFIVFCLTQLAPGDPATFLVDDNATPEQLGGPCRDGDWTGRSSCNTAYFLLNAVAGRSR